MPENWLEIPDIDFDTFNNNVVARYNHYGYGGTLCKLSSGHYYYINVDGEGNDRYMVWNGAGNEWQVYEPQDPKCTSCELRELLTYRVLFELLRESGHEALDAVGMIPLLGEPADLLNAGWYLLEGDMCQASMSAVGIFPVIGDIAGKSLKYIKKVGDAVEVVELTGDRLRAFDKLGKSISELSQSADVARGFENLARALGGTEESLRHLEVITDGMDTESVVRFLEKINNLDAGKRAECLADLATALKNADTDLAKRADELVDAWKVLSNGKASLRSIDNIKAVDAFRKANPQIADDAIQAAFEGMKSSRRQAFVNALKSCADNNKLIGSLNRIKLASVDEIKDALNKIRDYRTGKSGGGNYGYLDGTVSGNIVDDKVWRSGPANTDIEPQIFEAIPVTGSNGTTWLRNTDSEFKMLNKLADDLGGVKGKIYSDVTGTLKIVSENPYCASCQGIIQQFSEMFPNIEIKLIDGVR